MVLVIDDPVARPASEELVDEFERQTRLPLPGSYRDFLLKHNGGHPAPDFIDMPPEDDFPAQFNVFYGLDADEWFDDAWTKFKFFDTWIPFGLLMFGALSLECAELCFDFRRCPGSSVYTRFRNFLFGSELLDPMKENIPVKFFDWRYFNETRKFREKGLMQRTLLSASNYWQN
ncbi:SMI1/KNR4 family protein [Mesorhizobium sp. ZC-5]|uniref:SMI1/KNR4 family protein n=1 Tax=Mesorhizobium sp. ZC-5 TaxID=2986066 RepID=UPI0021E98A44|nr:SMI1/KNR4 family protein [Mesorhizobium sp. ZC-5]MCV3243116.1 SMI1/KNR4 family protein [Mesorhizobium sp. ZC-5]